MVSLLLGCAVRCRVTLSNCLHWMKWPWFNDALHVINEWTNGCAAHTYTTGKGKWKVWWGDPEKYGNNFRPFLRPCISFKKMVVASDKFPGEFNDYLKCNSVETNALECAPLDWRKEIQQNWTLHIALQSMNCAVHHFPRTHGLATLAEKENTQLHTVSVTVSTMVLNEWSEAAKASITKELNENNSNSNNERSRQMEICTYGFENDRVHFKMQFCAHVQHTVMCRSRG